MTFEQLVEVMEDNFKKFGWNTWQNKESVLFSLKAKYGDSLDLNMASVIFDTIYNRELEKMENVDG